MKDRLLEDLKAFRTPICEGLNAKLPYAEELADYLLSSGVIKELTEENERLRADKDYYKTRAKESEGEYDQAVKRGYNLGAIDYVGAFAERLKAEAITIQDHTGKLGLVVLVNDIDQIAKEMLEGEK